MRKRFETQMCFGITPIPEIKLEYRSRDELKPILLSLQKIYSTPETNEKIFQLLEASEARNRKKLRVPTADDTLLGKVSQAGRPGMNLWQIFVLATIRYGLNCNYARLHDLTINHRKIREFLGLDNYYTEGSVFIGEQTIIDNLKLLDAECLQEINKVIVDYSMGYCKKKSSLNKLKDASSTAGLDSGGDGVKKTPSTDACCELKKTPTTNACCELGSAETKVVASESQPSNLPTMHLRIDSFPIDRNVHFPTDYSLLRDVAKEVIRLMKKYISMQERPLVPQGLRKIFDTYKKLKYGCIGMSKIKYYKNNKDKVKEICERYLKLVGQFEGYGSLLKEKVSGSFLAEKKEGRKLKLSKLLARLEEVLSYSSKISGQMRRRVLLGEKITHKEKIFSIYEPQVEWINKGRYDKRINIGNVVSIATNEAHFIVNYSIYNHSTDVAELKNMVEKTIEDYPQYKVNGADADKGHHSKANIAYLKSLGLEHVVIPKRGKLSVAEKAVEDEEGFKFYRQKHAVIESDINMLQHHGLNRCLDHGTEGLERTVGCGVIAYNLHRLGNILILDEEKRQKALLRRRLKYQEGKAVA